MEKLFTCYRQRALLKNTSVPEMGRIRWPLQNYRELNGKPIEQLDVHYPKGKGGEFIIVCARHQSSGTQDFKTIVDYVR